MDNTQSAARRIVLGISGASGAVYARSLLARLLELGREVHLSASDSARLVIRQELGVDPGPQFDAARFLGAQPRGGTVLVHDDRDLAAPPASGTFRHDGMVICPCSMKTVGLLAAGIGSTLITRAADVCLKERRRLVLVTRETPLNLLHLRNMAALTEAGAVILPACPGFYNKPQTIDDLVDHVVLKTLDALGVENELPHRWA